MDKRLKGIVHYDGTAESFIQVGISAWVVPLDHPNGGPDKWDFNGKVTRTSTVESYDAATGRFETRNTIYEREGGFGLTDAPSTNL